MGSVKRFKSKKALKNAFNDTFNVSLIKTT